MLCTIIPRLRATISGRVQVEEQCAVSLEPLTAGNCVYVKKGQKVPVLATNLRSWGKPTWPIDGTAIDLAAATKMMPNLMVSAFFPVAYDEAVWYHTGASVLLVPKSSTFIEWFGPKVTMQTLHDRREDIGRYFAKFPYAIVQFVPWQLLFDRVKDTYGYDFRLCGPLCQPALSKVEVDFEDPSPVQIIVVPRAEWECLTPDEAVTVSFSNEDNCIIMEQDWKHLYGPLKTTKQTLLSKRKAVEDMFGKWPLATMNLTSTSFMFALLGPFMAHVFEPEIPCCEF